MQQYKKNCKKMNFGYNDQLLIHIFVTILPASMLSLLKVFPQFSQL